MPSIRIHSDLNLGLDLSYGVGADGNDPSQVQGSPPTDPPTHRLTINGSYLKINGKYLTINITPATI